MENGKIVRIPINKESREKIEGILIIPKSSKSLVIFVHGSGSSRYSPRNQYVSRVLNNDGVATLLIDLLTDSEEKKDVITKEFRFNISHLSDRLIAVTDWILNQDNEMNTFNKTLGYFGASTGSAPHAPWRCRTARQPPEPAHLPSPRPPRRRDSEHPGPGRRW